MFFISFRKHPDEEKENNLSTWIIKMQILFARAIITSTARASSVFPSSYRNTIFNQSSCIFFRTVFQLNNNVFTSLRTQTRQPEIRLHSQAMFLTISIGY